MTRKVSLDALIAREDFEVQDESKRITTKNTISITDLELDSFFFAALRKPDFQRETNEWDSQKICDFIESFLEGDLIPAMILWRNGGGYTFVIDGSHRISALAAWINDDYGDGKISKEFYDGILPQEQLDAADHNRRLVNKRIGSFSDHQLAVRNPEKVRPDIAERAKTLGALAIQLQWVEGDSSKAEDSFFKINQHAAPINQTEIRLLKARRKPNGLAARAISRSGKGHNYWSRFSAETQAEIQELAKEINGILFSPTLKNPVKSSDLPIGGKSYSQLSLALILDFINIINDVNNDMEDDKNGERTISFLKRCRDVARRINSNYPSSLGLHPIVYFYTRDGRYKPASFFAIVALVLDFEHRKKFRDFSKVRADFESLLIEYDYLVQQIVRKYRASIKSYEYVKNFYLELIAKLLDEVPISSVINEVINSDDFSYLTLAKVNDNTVSNEFSREVKSEAFIREVLPNISKCKICSGYLHVNSISIDHVQRKQDGGLGNVKNAQLTHPYCNSTLKN